MPLAVRGARALEGGRVSAFDVCRHDRHDEPKARARRPFQGGICGYARWGSGDALP
jgi:hypothetical protein